ncbi:MAG: PEP-CTERM sorting domain-containing protein [Candidatus Competibacteraceae bacterium]|nr:PEP-CTERM sorting domain-containing protein [Candidatus Competibacteraceae bacterium]MCP5125988.1 PEP-CTERM sorting domain-containing protein [Gammaproteobacteria bacterium]HRX70722.1 PEP-CTERM sorting domain-containing protein [Candidatus Competibacteraceae bacterium]
MNTKFTKLAGVLVLSGMSLAWSQGALAVPSTTPAPPCAVNDVKFGVYDDSTPAVENPADACYGPTSGNDPWNDPFGLYGFSGDPWSFSLAKWDFGTGYTAGSAITIKADTNNDTVLEDIGNIAFTLSDGVQDLVNGYNTFKLNWTYTLFDPKTINIGYIPVTMDLNIVTSQGSGYAQYLFSDETLSAQLNSDPILGYGTGSFEINYKCTGNTGPQADCQSQSDTNAFSHLSIYGRNVTANTPPNPDSDPDPDPDPIPEPASLGLLGLGLLAMNAIRRRKVVRG